MKLFSTKDTKSQWITATLKVQAAIAKATMNSIPSFVSLADETVVLFPPFFDGLNNCDDSFI